MFCLYTPGFSVQCVMWTDVGAEDREIKKNCMRIPGFILLLNLAHPQILFLF